MSGKYKYRRYGTAWVLDDKGFRAPTPDEREVMHKAIERSMRPVEAK